MPQGRIKVITMWSHNPPTAHASPPDATQFDSSQLAQTYRDSFVCELFAGIGALSTLLQQLGWTIALLCEIEPHLINLLSSRFLDAEVYFDIYHEPWLQWREQGFVVLLVTAGIACQPFSNRGLRLHKADPRAYQSLKVCDAAVALGAVYILLENVANFVDQDHIHGVFSVTLAYYQERGYLLTCVTTLRG